MLTFAFKGEAEGFYRPAMIASGKVFSTRRLTVTMNILRKYGAPRKRRFGHLEEWKVLGPVRREKPMARQLHPQKTKGLHEVCKPLIRWLLNLGSNQGPTD